MALRCRVSLRIHLARGDWMRMTRLMRHLLRLRFMDLLQLRLFIGQDFDGEVIGSDGCGNHAAAAGTFAVGIGTSVGIGGSRCSRRHLLFIMRLDELLGVDGG